MHNHRIVYSVFWLKPDCIWNCNGVLIFIQFYRIDSKWIQAWTLHTNEATRPYQVKKFPWKSMVLRVCQIYRVIGKSDPLAGERNCRQSVHELGKLQDAMVRSKFLVTRCIDAHFLSRRHKRLELKCQKLRKTSKFVNVLMPNRPSQRKSSSISRDKRNLFFCTTSHDPVLSVAFLNHRLVIAVKVLHSQVKNLPSIIYFLPSTNLNSIEYSLTVFVQACLGLLC